MKRSIRKKLKAFVLAVVMVLSVCATYIPGNMNSEAAGAGVTYRSYVQSYGWLGWVSNGQASGKTGEAKRLETIQIKLKNKPVSGGIKYRAYVQSKGWTGWVMDGAKAGTTGQSKRIEAMQIKLTGKMAQSYDVYYRVHAQSYGWLAWAKNGESAGTQGLARRIESVQVVLVKKNGKAPGNISGIKSVRKEALVTRAMISKEARNAYAKLINSIGELTALDESYVHYYVSLYDMDNDGVDEMYLSCHKYDYNGIYTYANGSIKKLSNRYYEFIPGDDGTLFMYSADGYNGDIVGSTMVPVVKSGTKLSEGNLKIVFGGMNKHEATVYFNDVPVADGMDSVNSFISRYGMSFDIWRLTEPMYEGQIIDADGAAYEEWAETWKYYINFYWPKGVYNKVKSRSIGLGDENNEYSSPDPTKAIIEWIKSI